MLDTIPWSSASSASSRGVQASTGRPWLRGEVQARLTISTTCSALKVVGAPERGASLRTAAMVWRRTTGSASTAASWASAAAQRARQVRTVGRLQRFSRNCRTDHYI